jgi:magnesium chelatase subunit D
VVFVVDTSGSMGATERIRLARESAVAMLQQAYQRRLKVALVTFAGEGASLRLRPTKSVEVAVARFDAVTYGGRTPLGDGLARAIEVVQDLRRSGMSELVVLLTDGRVNHSADHADPLEYATLQAQRIASLGIRSVVCDFEDSSVALGLARRFADAMGATYLPFGESVAAKGS